MSFPLRKEPDPEPNEPFSDVRRVRPTSGPIEPELEEEHVARVKSSEQDIVESDDIIDGDVVEREASAERPATNNPALRKDFATRPAAIPIDATPLFPENELQQLQSRWDKIQTDFVDRPRDAVREADRLVSSAMQRLSEVFSTERSKLEKQWDRGDSVSTEDLRVALQRYRSFFRRVLSI